MKFEKAAIKPFVPITITLETELEYIVMMEIMAAAPEKMASACLGIDTADVKMCFSKDTDNTAYQQLTAIKER